MNRKWLVLAAVVALLLVLGRFYINTSLDNHAISLIARFKDTPPVGQGLMKRGIGVYYRGFQVGRVTKITLSDDQEYVVFYIDITYRKLKLPENTRALLRTQNVLGDKFISLDIPFVPSRKLLANGSTIDGKAIVEDIGEIILNELGSGNVQKLMFSITNLANSLNTTIKDNNPEISQLLKGLTSSSGDAGELFRSFAEIIDDPQTKIGIKSTITYSSKTAKKINQIVTRREIGEAITKTPLTLDEGVKGIKSVNEHISRTTDQIAKTTEGVPAVTRSVNETSDRYNCLGKGLSEMLSQRFLVFRLLFGAPGSSLEKCK